jgi:hypothetical protein
LSCLAVRDRHCRVADDGTALILNDTFDRRTDLRKRD